MADLPIDIFINHIFMRLPVKSLLNCRCVCKQWRRLLTEHDFIRMHIKEQYSHNHQKLLIRIRSIDNNTIDANFNDFNSIFYSVDLEELSAADAVVRLLDFPLKDHDIIQILGSCNGMICMKVLDHTDKRNCCLYYEKSHILFWNPSMGDYKMLPDPIVNFDALANLDLIFGFGYDSSLDDYKLVRVNTSTQYSDIFSLKLNSWRSINLGHESYLFKTETETYCARLRVIGEDIGSFVDGSIYWFVQSSNTIVGFDLRDEEFRELQLPRDLPKYRWSRLKVLGGSLCILNWENRVDPLPPKNFLHMWSMLKEEENNNKKSNYKEDYYWIKLMTICCDITPLSFRNDGKVICSCQYPMNNSSTGKLEFALFDPETKKLEHLVIHGISYDSVANDAFTQMYETYIHSLVSPNYYG